MKINICFLGCALAVSAPGAYTYDYSRNPVVSDSTRWRSNGSPSFTSTGVTFGSALPGDSLISIPAISGANGNDYEVNTTMALKSGGGTYVHYLRADASFVGEGTGSYVSVELVMPTTFQSPGAATIVVYQRINQSTNILGAASVTATDGMTLRTVIFGGNLYVLVNNYMVYSGTPALSSGQPGIGGYGIPAGSGFSAVSVGPHDTVSPGGINATTIASSVFPQQVSLRWKGVLDDPNGIGLFTYWVFRSDQQWQAFSKNPEVSDSTVQASTTYVYQLVALDYHLNYSTVASVSVTTPPAGSIDPRRVGVATTGTYWGGGGEQIDTLAGNLNFTLPLLTAQSRAGGKIPLGLTYNSQNWRQDNGANWQLGNDGGYGYGWKLLLGSITPYYTQWYAVDHYIYTDSTGAEYRLDVNNNGVWASTHGVYVWFDSLANVLHFKDGTFWQMGSVSGGQEADAGTMYPTILEDPNGNQILVTYGAGSGLPASASNTSARIATIEDVRGKGAATYTFSYTADLHLSGISNTVGTAETYTFSYLSGQLEPPFGTDSNYAGMTKSSLATVQGANSSQWIFGYDTAGAGELTQAQFPDGGHIRWVYQAGQYNGSRQLRELVSRYVSPAAGAPEWAPYIFTFDNAASQTIHGTMTLTDASGVGAKTWNFVQPGLPANDWQVGLTSDYFQKAGATGAVLAHDTYTWSRNASNNPFISAKTSVTDPGTAYAQTSSHTMATDSYGNSTSQVAQDYAGGTRTSTSVWLQSQNSSYDSAYIRNRVTSTTVTDGTNTLPATTISYDTGTVSPAAGTPTEFDGIQGTTTNHIRGNPTQQVSLGVATNYTYDQTGSTTSGTNAAGTGTSLAYTATTNFGAPTGLTPMAGTADVQNGHTPTQASGSQLATGVTYTAALALAQSSMPNGATTSQTFNPTTGLLTQSVSVHGATTNYTYTFNPTTVTATTNGHWAKTYKDGFGRDAAVETGYGSVIVSHVDNVYGPCACSPLGKLVKTSAPYAIGPGGAVTASDGTSNIAWTSYVYDGLGRPVTMTTADGSVTTYVYRGNTTKVTDPAGNWKRTTSDVWGHLTKVEEPNPANGQTDNPATNFVTTYTYDLEDHLTRVSMPRPTGTQTRTFSYDLPTGHLMSVTNPESGTVSYTYYASGRLQSKTDAKGQKFVYSYDGYGRLAFIDRYPDGVNVNWCLATALSYDSGSSGSNLLARVSGAKFGDASCASNGGQTVFENYSYTAGGLVTAKGYYVSVPAHTDGGGYFQFSGYGYGPFETYSWDSEGNQTGYGSFVYTLDAMGRATGLTETGPGTVWVQNATYGPGGEAKGLQYRTSGGTYYTETRSYNSLNQLKQLVTSGSGLAGVNLNYVYNAGANNGQIAAVTDGNSGEQITYTYDALKRLQKAETTQNQTQYPNAAWWGQSFGYDGFGNLLSKTATAGHSGTAMSVGVDPSTNRLSGFGYDSNGNMTSIPGYPGTTLTYDMDNRTGGSVYDLENQPLDRGGAWNLYGLNGERLGTWTFAVQNTFYQEGNVYFVLQSVTATQASRNIYFGGRLIQSNGSSVATDRVGSVRATEGGVVSEYYPYGEEITPTADGREKFATYTRESSGALAGLDYANQRYYSSVYGRFTSADRYRSSTRPANPGSWNRYAYVLGDPINHHDRKGQHVDCDGDEEDPCVEYECDDGSENFFDASCGEAPPGTGGGAGPPGIDNGHPQPPPPPPPTCGRATASLVPDTRQGIDVLEVLFGEDSWNYIGMPTLTRASSSSSATVTAIDVSLEEAVMVRTMQNLAIAYGQSVDWTIKQNQYAGYAKGVQSFSDALDSSVGSTLCDHLITAIAATRVPAPNVPYTQWRAALLRTPSPNDITIAYTDFFVGN